jgi:hypothetical protein
MQTAKILTMVREDRFAMFSKVMTNLLLNTTSISIEWEILTYSMDFAKFFKTEFAIAKRNKHLIDVHLVSHDVSMPAAKARWALSHEGYDVFLVLDDDVLIAQNDFQKIVEAMEKLDSDKKCTPDMIVISTVDVENARGFPDYTDKVFSNPDGTDIILRKDIPLKMYGKVRFDHVGPAYGVSGTYIIKRDCFLALYESFIAYKKGERGYDTELFLSIPEDKRVQLGQATAWHIGCYEPFFNEHWKGMRKEVSDYYEAKESPTV